MKNKILLPIVLINSFVGTTVRQKKLLYSLLYRNPFEEVLVNPDTPSILTLADYQRIMTVEVDSYDLKQVIKSLEDLIVEVEWHPSETKVFKAIEWHPKEKHYFFYYNEEFVDAVSNAIFFRR